MLPPPGITGPIPPINPPSPPIASNSARTAGLRLVTMEASKQGSPLGLHNVPLATRQQIGTPIKGWQVVSGVYVHIPPPVNSAGVSWLVHGSPSGLHNEPSGVIEQQRGRPGITQSGALEFGWQVALGV